MNLRILVATAAGALSLIACGMETDPSASLTGTESQPLSSASANGGVVLSCPPEKALVCHVPPGNPANAHTLCVGKPAVKAHVKNHGDSLGACGAVDGGYEFNEGGDGSGDQGGTDQGGTDQGGTDQGSGDGTPVIN